MSAVTLKSQPALFLGDIDLPGFEDLPRILCEDKELVFEGQRIALPSQRLDLTKAIGGKSLKGWLAVLDWVASRVAAGQLLIVAHDDPLRELALLGAARGAFSYGLAFAQAPQRLFAPDYPVIVCATLCLFADGDTEERFRRAYSPHYNAVRADEGIVGIERAIARIPSAPQSTAPSGPAPLRVLLVAYFSGPARTVGVQRVNYWFDQIAALSKGRVQITLATATPWPDASEDIRIVPDFGPAVLIASGRQPEKWAVPFVESEKLNAKNFSTLSYYWRIALEQYFETRDDHFDVVIMSGNPFAVFDFAAYAKRRWRARVILDYRDPFANNPRITYTPQARDWGRYIEKGYNFQADLVTVVNDDCDLLVEGRADTPVAVIPNGFAETAIAPPQPRWREEDGRVHFVHAGSVYAKSPPTALIGVLDPERHRLHHIGNPAGVELAEQQASLVELHGTLPYVEATGLISRADCGIVFMSGDDFETPTKLYDYLAYGLDILLITNGNLRSGSIARVLDGLEGVYWAKNTPEALAEFLAGYEPGARRAATDTERFSRRASTLDLITKIGDLTGRPL